MRPIWFAKDSEQGIFRIIDKHSGIIPGVPLPDSIEKTDGGKAQGRIICTGKTRQITRREISSIPVNTIDNSTIEHIGTDIDNEGKSSLYTLGQQSYDAPTGS
jgi:hypothetical protein